MIIYLTGQPGSGKTTIARSLAMLHIPNAVIIDGDELREITQNFKYTAAGRERNLQTAHDVALFLNSKGFTPIIAMVSPFKRKRDALKKKTNVLEFHIFTENPTSRPRAQFHVEYYQPPTTDYTPICTDQPLDACIQQIMEKYYDDQTTIHRKATA